MLTPEARSSIFAMATVFGDEDFHNHTDRILSLRGNRP
jgi:hypothetical protein